MLYVIQLLGVAVFAASGALAAGRKRMDLMGALVIAAVTAVGGGTLRDLLLDRPVFWIADPAYLVVVVAAAGATMLYARRFRPPRHSLVLADALGLGVFTILGAQVSQASGAGGIVAVLMGAITGVAGGAIRDVLSAEIPMVMRKGEKLYASAAIAGTALYLALEWAGVPRPAAGVTGMATIVALRLAAIFWGLELPVVTVLDEVDGAERATPSGPRPDGDRRMSDEVSFAKSDGAAARRESSAPPRA